MGENGEMAMHLNGPSGVPLTRLKRQRERLAGVNVDVVGVSVGPGFSVRFSSYLSVLPSATVRSLFVVV